MTIAQELGDRPGIASTLGQLALLAGAEGDLAEAERLYRQNLALCRELGDVVTGRVTLSNLALLCESQGRLAEAASLLERAVEIGERVGLPDLAQDRYFLERVRLQMRPGCMGWAMRRAVAFRRALKH